MAGRSRQVSASGSGRFGSARSGRQFGAAQLHGRLMNERLGAGEIEQQGRPCQAARLGLRPHQPELALGVEVERVLVQAVEGADDRLDDPARGAFAGPPGGGRSVARTRTRSVTGSGPGRRALGGPGWSSSIAILNLLAGTTRAHPTCFIGPTATFERLYHIRSPRCAPCKGLGTAAHPAPPFRRAPTMLQQGWGGPSSGTPVTACSQPRARRTL